VVFVVFLMFVYYLVLFFGFDEPHIEVEERCDMEDVAVLIVCTSFEMNTLASATLQSVRRLALTRGMSSAAAPELISTSKVFGGCGSLMSPKL
jgi:hypothetical protein